MRTPLYDSDLRYNLIRDYLQNSSLAKQIFVTHASNRWKIEWHDLLPGYKSIPMSMIGSIKDVHSEWTCGIAWLNGDMITWLCDYTTTWWHDYMTTWLMLTQLNDYMTIQCHDDMTVRLHREGSHFGTYSALKVLLK